MKFTKGNLQKLQALFEAQGYEVRFEKGNFQSGYCLVETRKVAIVNRFFDTEGRINVLLDILSKIPIDETLFDEKQLSFYKKAFKVINVKAD